MRREKIIGSSIPRVGSREKVTGRAVYAVDVTLPRMLWGKVLRSPIAYGRIKRIDISEALAIPGVKAVLTGQDVTGIRIGRQIYDMPLLADGEVRFIGEKVAGVAGYGAGLSGLGFVQIKGQSEDVPPLFNRLHALCPHGPRHD